VCLSWSNEVSKRKAGRVEIKIIIFFVAARTDVFRRSGAMPDKKKTVLVPVVEGGESRQSAAHNRIRGIPVGSVKV
jgi:hypothetical protein